MLREGPMIDAHRVTLAAPDDFDGWRDAARDLAEAGVPPDAIVWQVEAARRDLFGDGAVHAAGGAELRGAARLRRACARARSAIRDPERFALLYAMLLRLRDQSPRDGRPRRPAARRLERLAKAVRRDIHKMRAFVRFREVEEGGTRFVAWFEPDITSSAPTRFLRAPLRDDALVDPDARASHPLGRRALSEGPGAVPRRRAGGDPLEEMWKTYYASIFNPARLEGRRDAQGNAEEILEQHARDGVGCTA